MKEIKLVSMQDYQPLVHQGVTLCLEGAEFVFASCEVHYQGISSRDGRANADYTSDTNRNMAKIPFDTPFVHHAKKNRIIGFRLLGKSELTKMKEKDQIVSDYECALQYMDRRDIKAKELVAERDQLLEPYKGMETEYWEKKWYFDLGNSHHIESDDPEKEVVGIILHAQFN